MHSWINLVSDHTDLSLTHNTMKRPVIMLNLHLEMLINIETEKIPTLSDILNR